MTVQDFGLSKRRRDIIVQLITQLTGVPVCWETEPRPQIDPMSRALIRLSIKRVNELDSFEEVTVNSSTGTITRMAALRTAWVEVLVESFDPEIYAHEIYLRLMTRIYRDRFRAILLQANVAVADNDDMTELPTTYDNRVVSAVVGGLHFNIADMDPVTDQLDTWIHTVNTNNIVPGTFT